MEIKLDMECIQLMNLFENSTGVQIKDCLLKNSSVYLVTEENQAHIVIGKDGRTIKNLERKIGKSIKVFEHSNKIETFIRNLIPKANEINVNGENDSMTADVRVNRADRSLIIGRDGRNLSIVKEILQRNSNVKVLNLR